LQSGYPLLKRETPEGVRGVLDESLDPADETSRFPEGRYGWLVHDHGEIVRDHLTGQREGGSVPLIVKFQIACGMPITKMNEYFGYLTKFENTIEEFHALYVANPSLEDPLIKSKREENMKIYIDLLNNSVIFLKKIKKAYQKL
jgi:hypothetical protein